MSTDVETMEEADDVVKAPISFSDENKDLAILLRRDVPLSNAVDLYHDVDLSIRAAQAKLAGDMHRRTTLAAIVDARMRDRKETKFNHPDRKVFFKPGGSDTDVRISELEKLETLKHPDGTFVIPREELAKGLYWTDPKPERKTNLTFLKPLKAYGEVVAEILDRAIVRSPKPDTLVIELIEPEKKAEVAHATAEAVV